MKQIFEKLKAHYGTHKAAAAALNVSYSRYNAWRRDYKCIPERSRNHLESAAKVVDLKRMA